MGCPRWELLPELSAPRPACIGAPFCPALLVLPPRVGDSPSGLLCCKCCSRPSLRTLPVLWTFCLDRPLRLACPSLCRVGPRLFPGSVPSFKPIGLLCPLIRCCQHLLWRAFTAPRLVFWRGPGSSICQILCAGFRACQLFRKLDVGFVGILALVRSNKGCI